MVKAAGEEDHQKGVYREIEHNVFWAQLVGTLTIAVFKVAFATNIYLSSICTFGRCLQGFFKILCEDSKIREKV